MQQPPSETSRTDSATGLAQVEALPEGLTLTQPLEPGDGEVLTPDALAFLVELQRRFGGQVEELLEARAAAQVRLDAGECPNFRPETVEVRRRSWTVAPIPEPLTDRRVEITGPVDAKTVINALNSPAQCFMADFEDATSPTWRNMVEGQRVLRGAVRGTLEHTDPKTGKEYALQPDPAVLLARPRGLHLPEKHVLVDGRPVRGAFFDVALYLFHNSEALVARGHGPYLYLPKLEHYREARLWSDVLGFAEEYLGLERSTVRVTVLIETITAAFQMDSILWELRDYCVGLNCGRWDYIFSVVKRFRAHSEFVLPDRDQVGMTRHFLSAYSRRLVRVCHRRGALAIGGMAAHVPQRNDPDWTRAAIESVREDKRREVHNGHDGTWVAHPALIPVAAEVFSEHMDGPNQLDVERRVPTSKWRDLLTMPSGTVTADGLRRNLDVALRYIGAWLSGVGCVAIHGMMEDAATAEIARAQVWQWRVHAKRMDDGRVVDTELVRTMLDEVAAALADEIGAEAYEDGRYGLAESLLSELVLSDQCHEFLTTLAYEHI